jgi:hypothetical protein
LRNVFQGSRLPRVGAGPRRCRGGELPLQLLLSGEEVPQHQLRLARVTALGLVAVQPALEQRILMRQVGNGVLQRLHLRGGLRLDPYDLRLQRRDQRAQIRCG